MHNHSHDEGGHDHHDHHHSGIGHAHAPKNFGPAFLIGMMLNSGFVIAEVIFGLSAHSLALLSDAGHNLSDVFALGIAWGASVLVKSRPTKRFTYGLRSSSIAAALLNATILLVVTGGIAWEAIRRFSEPQAVSGFTMIAIAGVGILVNGITALMFMAGRKDDINIQGAFLHMAGDAAVAFGVVIAGVIIHYTGWFWVDPAVGLIIGFVILLTTWSLLSESIKLTLQAVPSGIDPDAVADYLKKLPHVKEVHDLHIWGMSTTETALTAHLVRSEEKTDDTFLQETAEELKTRFGIVHATIQVETGSTPCCLEGPDTV
jgi:cobalt-zinc-cadmium efflux system protein